MKRRDVLWTLVGVSGVAGGGSSAQPRSLPTSAVAELMRAHGLEPLPGEAVGARALLESARLSSTPDPRIEPAIRLDPELD